MGISIVRMSYFLTSTYKMAYSAVRLPSEEICQPDTRLRYKKKWLTNQAPDKITHFTGREGHRVDSEISVVMIQLQVVPHYCRWRDGISISPRMEPFSDFEPSRGIFAACMASTCCFVSERLA